MVVEEDSSGDLGNGGIGSGTPGVGVTAVEDAQAARLTALAGLISSVDDKVCTYLFAWKLCDGSNLALRCY